MEKQDISYAQAVAEIEQIIARMSSSELDVDKLGSYVERATELLTLCKGKLVKAQQQVEKQLTQEK